MIIHDRYWEVFNNRYNDRYDIALISLHHHPLEINNRVVPAPLAEQNRRDIVAYSEVTVAGWGHTRREEHPQFAQKGKPRVLTHQDCLAFAAQSPDIVYDEHFHFCYVGRQIPNTIQYRIVQFNTFSEFGAG